MDIDAIMNEAARLLKQNDGIAEHPKQPAGRQPLGMLGQIPKPEIETDLVLMTGEIIHVESQKQSQSEKTLPPIKGGSRQSSGRGLRANNATFM